MLVDPRQMARMDVSDLKVNFTPAAHTRAAPQMPGCPRVVGSGGGGRDISSGPLGPFLSLPLVSTWQGPSLFCACVSHTLAPHRELCLFYLYLKSASQVSGLELK